jgi:ABC-type multidrug transport system fused ATPase/permease subunit
MIKRALLLGLRIRDMMILGLFALFGTFSEIIGIGIFYPIFKYMNMEGDIGALIADSQIWTYIVNFSNILGIELSLFSLFATSFCFILFKTLVNYKRVVYVTKVTQGLTKKLRKKYFKRYMGASTSYHDRVAVGDLVNAMTTELASALYMVTAPIDFIVFSIMSISYLFVLVYLSWQMTIVALIVLIIVMLTPFVWVKKSKKVGKKLASSNSHMSSFLVDRMKSPRLVRLSGTEDAEILEFNDLITKQKDNAVNGSVLQAKADSVIEPMVIVSSMTFIYLAYNHFDIEIIGIYLLIILRLTPVAKQLLIIVQKVRSKTGSYDLVQNRLRSMENNTEVDEGSIFNEKIFGDILFNNVGYKYNEAKKSALKNINIKISEGSIVAIIGPSGGGKSTLIDLLPRLRELTYGSIKIGNHLSNKYNKKALRKAIAYAPQSPQIFYGTIENHIKYGKIDASDEEVYIASKLAGADEFIQDMPKKYKSIVGSDGVRLSGGQKQRIDLARALIRKSAILILDEPTSNLDFESEIKFMESLRFINAKTGITIIIVTHNIPSIIDADKIVVLNKGIIEEEGTHIDLLNNNGWYSRAWKSP